VDQIIEEPSWILYASDGLACDAVELEPVSTQIPC